MGGEYNYNLYAVVHINLLFHHFCHIPGIHNNKLLKWLVQYLRIIGVNCKVEEGRGIAGGRERKGGGRQADRGRVRSGGAWSKGGRECWRVGRR